MVLKKLNESISIPQNDIKEITLLSVDEAEKIPKWILATGDWWWTRSPGFPSSIVPNNNSNGVVWVYIDGYVIEFGHNVNDDTLAVRPALRISNLPNLKIGDIVECLDMNWYYVGDDLILAVDSIGKHYFNYDKNKPNANIFEGSDIQKYLQDWLEEQKPKKYFLFDSDTKEKIKDDDLNKLLEIIYDRLESGKSSKLKLINNLNKKQKIFTLNDLENL